MEVLSHSIPDCPQIIKEDKKWKEVLQNFPQMSKSREVFFIVYHWLLHLPGPHPDKVPQLILSKPIVETLASQSEGRLTH